MGKTHGLAKKRKRFWKRKQLKAEEALSIETLETLLEESTKIQSQLLLTRLEDQQAITKQSQLQASHAEHVVQRTRLCAKTNLCRPLDIKTAQLTSQLAQLEAAIQTQQLKQLTAEQQLLMRSSVI